MKELFALLKSDLLQIRSFDPAFPLCMPKTESESLFIALLALCKEGVGSWPSFKKSVKSDSLSSLFTKRAKRGIRSFALKK